MAKIAIIDDDASIRRTLEFTLKMHDHKITTFENPKDFLQASHCGKFDLLLVDIDMPHMTGIELYEKLSAEGDELPQFVLMSGRVTDDNEGLPKGITCLEKPFSLAALLEVTLSAQ